MRLFTAVEIENSDVLSRIISIKRKITQCGQPRSIKPVEDSNIHITLRFIGEVGDESIEDIIECVKRSGVVKPFEVEVKSVGAFPTLSRPRVIWIGVGKGAEELKRLKKIMDPCLKPYAKGEKTEFTPHITIARIKGRFNVECFKTIVNAFRDSVFGYTPVTEVKLKKSTLRPQGPVYTDVFTVSLKGKEVELP